MHAPKKTPVNDQRGHETDVLTLSEAADVLTLSEAADVLRVHPETLRSRAALWGVPHKRLGSAWRFSRETLTAWLKEREAA